MADEQFMPLSWRVHNSNRTRFGATNRDDAKCSHQTPTHHCDFSVGSNTVRLYFRRELALAQSLFDRFLAAIDQMPMGLVVASVGGLFHIKPSVQRRRCRRGVGRN